MRCQALALSHSHCYISNQNFSWHIEVAGPVFGVDTLACKLLRRRVLNENHEIETPIGAAISDHSFISGLICQRALTGRF